MRVVITGGGTGGHIYPGLAIAEAVRELHRDAEVLFIGGDGLERRIIPQEGWSFRRVVAGRIRRAVFWQMPWAVAVTAAGTAQALLLLRAFRPHAVAATGGYASAPVGAAAAALGIPLVVQEQNLYPGATNRILARWATIVSVPHESVAARFPGKAVVTGVPVRAKALRGDRIRGRRRFGLDERDFTILVLGGSQGARSLNTAVAEMRAALASGPTVQIVHQTGNAHIAGVQEQIAPPPGSLRYVAVPYIEDVADAYACADLVICRAGASTLAEVTANGRPVIAVPYPYAAAGHQESNARLLESAGAAVVVLDGELSGRRLADEVTALRSNPGRLEAMAAASRRLGRPQAARAVAELVLQAATRR